MQAHLLDRHQLARQAGLARRLDHVGDGHEVLARVLRSGVQEVRAVAGQPRRQLLPALDEQLVDHVPLVAAGAVDVLHPVPLDRGLDQRGRRVRVVLEQLEAVLAVGEVEAPVDHRRLGLPRLLDPRDGPAGDPQLREQVALDDVVTGLDEHLQQQADARLHLVDLVGGQRVGVGLVPVGHDRAVGQLGLPVDEALLLDDRRPALPGLDVDPVQLTRPRSARTRQRPTPLALERPLDPNPPRRAFSAMLDAATWSPPVSLVPRTKFPPPRPP